MRLSTLLALFAVPIIAGCAPGASIAWSPDGRRAVYAVGLAPATGKEAYLTSATLMDADGKAIADLGPVYSVPMAGGEGPAAGAAGGEALVYYAPPRPPPPGAPTAGG